MTLFGVIVILFAVYALASTAGIFAERSGTINLSIDGTMTVAAAFYILFANVMTTGHMQGWTVFVAAILAIIFGMLFNTLLSIAAINLKGNQVVIGTALNALAPIISLMIVVSITSGQYSIPNVYQLSVFVNNELPNWWLQLIVAVISLLIVGLLAVLMKYTVLGLRLRAAGENPFALEAAGVSVSKIRHYGMLFSGFLASLAGIFAVMTYDRFSSFDNNVLGMGFIAISILIIGQWRITWSVLGALLFAIIYSIVDKYSLSVGSYQWLVYIVPYAATLICMPLVAKFSKQPKADGVPYINTGR